MLSKMIEDFEDSSEGAMMLLAKKAKWTPQPYARAPGSIVFQCDLSLPVVVHSLDVMAAEGFAHSYGGVIREACERLETLALEQSPPGQLLIEKNKIEKIVQLAKTTYLKYSHEPEYAQYLNSEYPDPKKAFGEKIIVITLHAGIICVDATSDDLFFCLDITAMQQDPNDPYKYNQVKGFGSVC